MKLHSLAFLGLISFATVAVAAPGMLRITTDPGDAQIFVNGQRKGNSPSQEGQSFAVKLPQGEYTVEARKSDGGEYYGRKTVYMANDSLQTVSISLVNLPFKPYGNAANGSTVVNGLEWLRCSVGQQWSGTTCMGSAKEFTFEEAQKIPNTFNAAGYAGKRDWRLPTIRELASLRVCSARFHSESKDLKDGGTPVSEICNDGSIKPTIDTTRFPQTPSEWYWSSTPDAGLASYAWLVDFSNGYVLNLRRDVSFRVRLVR